MMKCLVAAVLVSCATPAPAAGGLPSDLAKTVKDYAQAQFRNDVSALAHLVTDDFLLVNSNASVENKKQFLADFNLPGFRIDRYVFQQPIAKVWANGAVTGGLLHLRWVQDGKDQSRWIRIAYVWEKRDGRWQATYAQVTRVQE